MPGPKRTKFQIEHDRRITQDMYLRGKTQADIADALGVTQQQISYDLKAIQQQWREDTTIDLDEAKQRELARIDLLEREYWDAWERSCDEFKVKTIRAKGANAEDAKNSAEQTMRTEPRNGDPRFLAGVQWCISERSKLLGIYAPTRQEVTGANGDALHIVIDK